MAKFCGLIGFGETVKEHGVVKDKITERRYYGDLIRNSRLLQSQNPSQVNDNINIANQISILADPYAVNNIYSMRYVEFMNAKWKITNVEVQEHRLILTVGGVYNG